MFRKLLSNLPFNPSLIGQVAFYARRLHREQGLRRTGLILVVLSMLLQMFAAMSPTEASRPGSTNDIIYGGLSSKSDAVKKCTDNVQDFAVILAYYRVSCEVLASANTVQQTLNSRAFNGELDSLGRKDPGANNPNTGKPTNRYAVSIGSGTYYMKNLWSWDTGASSDYPVLRVINSDNQIIYIIMDCGNIVTVKQYTPPQQPPPNRPASAAIQAQGCEPGQRRIFFGGYAFDADKPSQSLSVTLFIDGERINNFRADVPRPDVNDFFGITGNHGFEITLTGSTVTRYLDNRSHEAYVTAAGINTAGQEDGNNKRSNIVTFGPCQVQQRTPNPTPIPPSVPPPTDACPYPEYPGNQQSTDECRPCEGANGQDDTAACAVPTKAARNNTQNIANADGTQAAPSDSITYTLSVKNIGNTKIEDFEVKEDLSDVLEYAEVTDSGGGTVNNQQVITWPKVDIAAGQTVSKQLTIKVKANLPETPRPTTQSTSWDLIMTNVYGNAINIRLPGSVAKVVEQTTTALPNTGPGETVAIAMVITFIAAYYFARTRLMAKELDIVREEYSTGGA